MATPPLDDQNNIGDVDPLEILDQEEVNEEDEANVSVPEEVIVPDLGPELEDDIKEILATEEPNAKQKNQMIPQDLIDRALTPDDLIDEGSI